MKPHRVGPHIPVKIHVMDNVNKVNTVQQNQRAEIVASLQSTHYGWLYTDGIHLYKIHNNTKSITLQANLTECYNLCEVQKDIYIIHEDGYSIWKADNQIVIISFDSLITGFSQKYLTCYTMNEEKYTTINFETGDVQSFDRQSNTSCIIVRDVNNNTLQTLFENNNLHVFGKVYTVPTHPVLDHTAWYNINVVNEHYIVVESSSDFVKNWYILFDKKTQTFGHWTYMKSIDDIQYLMTINKIMICYEDIILITSNSDFKNLLTNTSLEQLLLSIDKGCNSMVYHKDSGTLYCINDDESYVVYISNNRLIATMTCFPYKMHILHTLTNKVVHLKIHFHEVLIQYDNLDIVLITL